MVEASAVSKQKSSIIKEIRQANQNDDADLRTLLRESVVPGSVSVAFTREPSYFDAESLAGSEDITIISRHNGSLSGMARCSINSLYRNGEIQRIGYLGELRVLPGAPASPRLLREGYKKMAQETSGKSVDGFFTSIGVDNARARTVLEQGTRIGLPRYRPLASLVTILIPVPRNMGEKPSGLKIAGNQDKLLELLFFLRQQAKQVHLSMTWDELQLSALAKQGVNLSDFDIIHRDGKIVGAALVWDQRAFRQTVIDRYHGITRGVRPFFNTLQVLRGRPILPAPGSIMALGAILGAAVSDLSTWPSLLKALLLSARSKGLSWLSLSSDARDPRVPLLRKLVSSREYHTTLYSVNLGSPTDAEAPHWDQRLYSPEVSLL